MELKKLENQKMILNRISSIFENNKVAHAYLFEGDQGVGKEAVALFFSRLLLCESPENNVPCETCRSCRRVLSGNHPNISVIRPDGQNIKKDQITTLIFGMTRKGFESGRKIYIIAHADRLHASAANALLKFLEEPEGEVTAILLTDSYPSLLPTIQSRCQRISLLPASREVAIEMLMERGITASMAATATMVIATAEEAFVLAEDEQFALFRKTVLKLVEVLDSDIHEALLFIQTNWLPIFKEKEDVDSGLDLLLFAYRDIVACKAGLNSLLAFPDQIEFFEGLAMKMTYRRLSEIMEAVLQAKKHLHSNMNRTLLMEQFVLNMREGLLVV